MPANESAFSMSPIFTWHETILYADLPAREMRHGQAGSVNANVHLEQIGEFWFLYCRHGNSTWPIICEPDRCVMGDLDQPITSGTALIWQREGDGRYSLSAQGRYLSAHQNGSLQLDRPKYLPWESFTLRGGTFVTFPGMVVERRIHGQRIRFFVNNPQDIIQRHHATGAFWERDLLALIQDYCIPKRLFIDIGANIGNHTVFVSRFCDVSGVMAFEPNPAAIALLELNVLLNDCRNVDLTHCGVCLGAADGCYGIGETETNNLGHTTFKTDPEGKVRSVPGDAILAGTPVGFIKIDVEGMELDVLNGLSRTIQRWRPNLMVEVQPNNLEAFRTFRGVHGYRELEAASLQSPLDHLLVPVERC